MKELEIVCGKVLSEQQSCLLSSGRHSSPSRWENVLGQIQQVAIQYWVIAQTLVIFQTNLKGTAQLQLLQLLWPLGDVIFYAE